MLNLREQSEISHHLLFLWRLAPPLTCTQRHLRMYTQRHLIMHTQRHMIMYTRAFSTFHKINYYQSLLTRSHQYVFQFVPQRMVHIIYNGFLNSILHWQHNYKDRAWYVLISNGKCINKAYTFCNYFQSYRYPDLTVGTQSKTFTLYINLNECAVFKSLIVQNIFKSLIVQNLFSPPLPLLVFLWLCETVPRLHSTKWK